MLARAFTARLSPALLRASKARVVAPSMRTGAAIRNYGNITYSGGQASEGQGGFYGSGGARVLKTTQEHRPELLAMAEDVETIVKAMQDLSKLERKLEDLLQKDAEDVSATIELRSAMKRLMTSPEMTQCLNRLEVKGEPVWGLSSSERELIIDARKKVNEC